ncbi:MAG: amidohydrolase [Synergistaceae bacterium]|jgi:amidohydrolase|nr:amidohydrolase [Synergistaceae bacterium]
MDAAKIKRAARAMEDKIIRTRRYLHARPEVSWREFETTDYVENRLRGLGLDGIRRGFGGTCAGVTADLSGSAAGPCVALRADMDALPITEENSVDYRSQNRGAMHACGHDGHMAALLGAAEILAEMRSEIPGRVRFIFQPAEEIGDPSGACAMVKEGVLDGVDAIGGMHLWSFVRSGLVQWRSGPVMASSDRLNVTFIGKGGHGAMPHTAIDPIVAAAAYINAIQTITSREIDPTDAAVITIGHMNAGETFNVIPSKAELLGSLRSFNPRVRSKMEERLSRVAGGIASAYRCEAETSVKYMIPCVSNDADLTKTLKETAVEITGPDDVEESPLLMISEDFSMYQEKIPGTFFFLGAGNEADAAYPHHSPKFGIDESVLPLGASLLAAFAIRAMESFRENITKI